jgi:uncharacterized protein YjfI (DUF2170 family)
LSERLFVEMAEQVAVRLTMEPQETALMVEQGEMVGTVESVRLGYPPLTSMAILEAHLLYLQTVEQAETVLMVEQGETADIVHHAVVSRLQALVQTVTASLVSIEDERLFNSELLSLFIIQLYNHP